MRNAVEHSDEKLLGKQYRNSPPFASREPYSIRLANTSVVIGGWVLAYRELVSAMTKMYRTIEAGQRTGNVARKAVIESLQVVSRVMAGAMDEATAALPSWAKAEWARSIRATGPNVGQGPVVAYPGPT